MGRANRSLVREAISHCAKTFKEKMNKDKKVKNQFLKKLIHNSSFDTKFV